jgi:hypothetical protein
MALVPDLTHPCRVPTTRRRPSVRILSERIGHRGRLIASLVEGAERPLATDLATNRDEGCEEAEYKAT